MKATIQRALRGFASVANLAVVAMAISIAAVAGSGRALATPSPDLPATDEERIAELVDANRILATYGVLDSFGHVSVRSASNPNHFFMSKARAPGLVNRVDIMEFDENSEPIDRRGRDMYLERYIHGEILRARPEVMAVVHSHAPEVLPFTVTKVPLKAVIHMAAFLGNAPVPVWDIRNVMGPDNPMLVLDNKLGASLAATLGDRSVVLMRGHGMAVPGRTLKIAVSHAIYTQLNAKVLQEALRLGAPNYLTEEEDRRFQENVTRPWELWLIEAERMWGPKR